MKRSSLVIGGLAIALGLGSWVEIAARADDAAPTTAPTADQLVKHGTLFVTPEDDEVVAGMKNVRALRKKVDDQNKARLAMEAKVNQAKSFISQKELEGRKLNDQLATVKDVTQNNNLVAKINIIVSQIKEAEEFKNAQEAKLKVLGNDDRTNYINGVLDLSTKSDKAQKDYVTLATDADVKVSLETAKPKGKLGPSSDFVAAAAQLKKWRADITSDVVPVTVEGHVPNVEVTINGKFTRTMVFDSGASMVTLPADIASSFDLVPGPKDPVVHLVMADGKEVEAHMMVLQSVRVGTFTVENVECAVLPPNLIAAQPLLGGTFLHNFIYKLDVDAGELHLAKVGGATTVQKVDAAGGKPGAKPGASDKDMPKPQ